MTIDSRIVNGRFVEPDGLHERAISIDGGRVIPDIGESDDVWRTVNASGYFVLPGMIQPGPASGDGALNRARQGMTTMLTPIRATSPDELPSLLETLQQESNLDHIPVCEISGADGHDMVDRARSLGISAFDFSGESADPALGQAFHGCTVRVPASSPAIQQWVEMAAGHGMRLIIHDISANTLATLPNKPESTHFETNLSALLEDHESGKLWHAIADGTIDLIVDTDPEPDRPLLAFLYHDGVVARQMPVSRLAELTSVTPARAYGVSNAKGTFDAGSHGDLFVFDAETADRNNTSPWPGRVIFSLQRGTILLYNDELHALPGDGQRLGS